MTDTPFVAHIRRHNRPPSSSCFRTLPPQEVIPQQLWVSRAASGKPTPETEPITNNVVPAQFRFAFTVHEYTNTVRTRSNIKLTRL